MRGLSGVNIPNLPGINKYAKYLGDYSSLRSGTYPVRVLRGRVLGYMVGKTFGGVKTHLGAWGLVGVGEFFGFARDLVRYYASSPVWFGSMANYAKPVDRGYITKSGKSVPPAPYFSNALVQAHMGMTRRGRRGSAGTGLTAVRSGLYEGQRYIGDFGAFFRGDLSRIARRTSGQEVAGFFWGTFRITETGIKGPPNLMGILAMNVIRNARNNLKRYGKVDTGVLRSSLAWGGSQDEFMQNSIMQATRRALQRGIGGQIAHRIADPSDVPQVEPLRNI